LSYLEIPVLPARTSVHCWFRSFHCSGKLSVLCSCSGYGNDYWV